MSILLQALHLAPAPDQSDAGGLVSVRKDGELPPQSVAERVAQREARLLEGTKAQKNISVDYIFFRRFGDERSSQVAAYVLDNSTSLYSREAIAELHARVWLNGSAPLLYVEWPTHVDVLKCAAEPLFWDKRTERPEYVASETIDAVSEVSKSLDAAKVRRFSAYRLSNGTFWEDPENSHWARAEKAAHRALIHAVVEADRALNGKEKPLMRRMLLLTILCKYLEDRGVFPANWFAQFEASAQNFQDVLKSGKPDKVRDLLAALKKKFNGDIFEIEIDLDASLNRENLQHFVTLLEANTIKKQMFLWKQYSFNYIPIEVLSHVYQHFAQEGKGAVFTPPFVADLMLDHAMPFEKITGDERILDPTCGSGIFLVGAFRRLVHHWQSHNNWNRPSVSVLKEILRKSIYGVEDGAEAAHIASFNLALAMCDALQPKVIWSQLRFDKLIGRNLFVGDFFKHVSKLREKVPSGFTTVLGNPPFLSKLTEAAVETRPTERKKIPIPDGQMAYRVAEESMTLLHPDGCLCLIEPHGFLYNAKARAFLADFLANNTVETILDFVSIRKLFEGADPKTIAIVAKLGKPEPDHTIVHQTFRRTKSVHEKIAFELDHYDRHLVHLEAALETPWIWKANLLGGSRIASIGKRAEQFPNIKTHCMEQGWDYGEGFIAAKSGKREPAAWLSGKPYLPTENLTASGIQGKLGTVEAEEFRSAYSEKRYSGPIVMIRANEQLPSAFRSTGFLAYRAKIIGISAGAEDTKMLGGFANAISESRMTLRFLLYLFSTQMLLGKSTAILKRDFDELPSPSSGFFKNMSWWEKVLVDDVLNYFAKMVRTGQNSEISQKQVDAESFNQYAKTFVKLLGSVYRNLRPGKSGTLDGLAYHAFYFGESCELNWPDDWSNQLEEVIFKNSGTAIQTTRILRFYEKNTLIIVKPDRLRHWIASTAIRDADETLVDLQEQGF